MISRYRLSLLLYIPAILAACTGSATPPSDDQGVIVTFRVAGAEQYKIHLTDPANIEIRESLPLNEENLTDD